MATWKDQLWGRVICLFLHTAAGKSCGTPLYINESKSCILTGHDSFALRSYLAPNVFCICIHTYIFLFSYYVYISSLLGAYVFFSSPFMYIFNILSWYYVYSSAVYPTSDTTCRNQIPCMLWTNLADKAVAYQMLTVHCLGHIDPPLLSNNWLNDGVDVTLSLHSSDNAGAIHLLNPGESDLYQLLHRSEEDEEWNAARNLTVASKLFVCEWVLCQQEDLCAQVPSCDWLGKQILPSHWLSFLDPVCKPVQPQSIRFSGMFPRSPTKT